MEGCQHSSKSERATRADGHETTWNFGCWCLCVVAVGGVVVVVGHEGRMRPVLTAARSIIPPSQPPPLPARSTEGARTRYYHTPLLLGFVRLCVCVW